MDTIAEARRRNKELDFGDYEYLRERAALTGRIGAKAMPAALPVKRGGTRMDAVNVDGATAQCAEIENIEIAEGRYFTSGEDLSTANVAFIGADVARVLGAAAGDEIAIRGLPYRVVGVATARGNVFGVAQDTFITIPLRTYLKHIGPAVEQRGFYMVATARDDEQFEDAVEEVRGLLRTRRGLGEDETDNFDVTTPEAIMGLRDGLLGPIFIAAVAVPGIALIVGGIVIMNIMLVSVTERTKEIGIRMSLGARRRDILRQFLVEAVALSAFGGVIGVGLAWGVGRVATAVLFPTDLSLAAILVAVLVSGLVGVLSGLLPARRAARLDPIEALRME
jgi:putative ABC transport system permease protein